MRRCAIIIIIYNTYYIYCVCVCDGDGEQSRRAKSDSRTVKKNKNTRKTTETHSLIMTCKPIYYFNANMRTLQSRTGKKWHGTLHDLKGK